VNRPVVIFSDLLPPKRGGLADHTYNLAKNLAVHHPVTVISSVGVSTEAPFTVRPVMEDWRDLALLRAELSAVPVDAVLFWQYVPHMYGHGGVNRQLPKFVRELHRARRPQVVLAHEITADYSWHPVRFWYTWNHRRQWRQLLRYADVVPVACGKWVEHWSRRRRRMASKMFTVPSPSSLPLEPVGPDHRAQWRRDLQLDPSTRVLAYFGTLNPTKQLPWILEAWANAHTPDQPVAFVIVGAAPNVALEGELRQYFRPLGHLAGPEASRALSAVDLLAFPFVDGVSERRSSLMTGLHHGVPIVSTIGHNTGSELRKADWIRLAPVKDRNAFVRAVVELLNDAETRTALGKAGQAQYEREFSWPRTVERLRERFPL
jgi:glycosyltransferase involved in cell wall biosynthesis